MPNGFHGTRTEWDRLEAQFRDWDWMLNDFAREHGLTLSKNEHGWPGRSLEAFESPLRRKIEVVVNADPVGTFDVWAYAWSDAGGQRRTKILPVRKSATAAEIGGSLPEVLNDAWQAARAFSERDLE